MSSVEYIRRRNNDKPQTRMLGRILARQLLYTSPVIDMTLEQWSEYGYQVVIDEGFVYLVRPNLEVGYVTSTDNGNWTKHQNVNRLPWRFVNLRNHSRILDLARAQSFEKCA